MSLSSKANVRLLVIVVVCLAWLASIVATLVLEDYETPAGINAALTAILGWALYQRRAEA